MTAQRYYASRPDSRSYWRVYDRRTGAYVLDTICEGRAEARSIARTLNHHEGSDHE